MRRILQSVLISLLLLAGAVQAHLLNMTELNLRLAAEGPHELVVRIDLGQSLMTAETYWQAAAAPVAEQESLLQPAIARLQQHLAVTADGRRLGLALKRWQLEARSLEAIRNPLTPQMAVLTFDVATFAGRGVEVQVLPGLDVPWPCLLRVDLPGAATPVSRLLTDDHRDSRVIALDAGSASQAAGILAAVAAAFQAWAPELTWVAVGFQHIIPMGVDHIAFILGLFFLAPRVSTLFWQVTCFTGAHTVTLGLASLGLIHVPPMIVEPLIAASIVYVAVDNLYSTTLARWRLVVVSLFGLLHGLGFASALGELQLPEENVLTALLLFNLGVEFGQIAVLVLAFAAVGWLRNWSGYTGRVARPATMTIAGAGAYWLIKRVVF